MHLTKETRNKIDLTIFGLTLFPAVVYGLKALFIDSPATFSGDFVSFYRSLMDMGRDGMVAWESPAVHTWYMKSSCLYGHFPPEVVIETSTN